jgi:hypothetical protein
MESDKKKQYNKNNQVPNNLTANDLHEHFSTLFGSPNREQNFNILHQHDDFLDNDITEIEIRNAVFSQNNGKSPGNDMLIAEIF